MSQFSSSKHYKLSIPQPEYLETRKTSCKISIFKQINSISTRKSIPVLKIASGNFSCDDIIRQHKAACLRVTALLASRDFLWIGTSAGVILTMPLPHITTSTAKISTPLTVTGVPHGHTGHVRFLTTVDVERRRGKQAKKPLMVSGGDGYEDFRSSSVSELAGREDSTNHILLWQV